MTNPVKTSTSGHILEVVFDRPPANAIDAAASRALGEAMIGFRDDPDLRVAILTGGGEKFFSAGWDLKAAAEAGADVDQDFGPGGFGGLTQLFDLDKPVIAAVNGYCVAGGFELALACDLMVAADHAVFFMAEVNVGLVPGVPTVPRLVAGLPRAIAFEILLTGDRISAMRLAEHGLVNKVVPGSELMDAARGMAQMIADAAPMPVAGIKEVARKAAPSAARRGRGDAACGCVPALRSSRGFRGCGGRGRSHSRRSVHLCGRGR